MRLLRMYFRLERGGDAPAVGKGDGKRKWLDSTALDAGDEYSSIKRLRTADSL